MEHNQLTVTSSHISPPLQLNSFSRSELMKMTIFTLISLFTLSFQELNNLVFPIFTNLPQNVLKLLILGICEMILKKFESIIIIHI